MKTFARNLTFGLSLVLIVAGGSVHAGLLNASAYSTNPSFSNPFDATSFVENQSFEDPSLTLYTDGGLDRCNYVAANVTTNVVADNWLGGWTNTGTDTTSTYRYRPGVNGLKSNGGYFWDPTDGVNGAALILRSGQVLSSWIYQSLGTVGPEDIGLTFIAMIDSSTRVGTSNYEAERQISFRTGVTAGRNGDFGDLVSMDVDTATRQSSFNDPWHTLVDWFQPTEADLGKEIFLVFSAQNVGSGYSGQYQFDNVRLWAVPEPGTMCLVVMGAIGLLCCLGRRRRCR